MQVFVNKSFLLTLFEIPHIAINSLQMKNALLDDELEKISENLGFKPKFDIEINDTFAAHEDISSAFEDLSCSAFKDTILFFLSQMNLPSSKQDKKRLNILSTLLLSRIMPTIHSFNKDEKTKVHKTEFHWNVVLG